MADHSGLDAIITLPALVTFKDGADAAYAASSHSHGSVTSDGAITSDTAAASGDKLVIADSSDSSKLKRSGIALGSSTSTFLRNDGTWAEPSGGSVSYVTTTATLTANGWSSDSQTVSCSPVTASNDVIVAPAPASAADYAAAGIVCTAQGSGTLTFTCTTTPSSAITVNVLVLSGGAVVSEPVAHSVTNGSTGYITINKTSAYAGETVKVTNNSSSTITGLTVNDVNQLPSGYQMYSGEFFMFTMPDEDVTVVVTGIIGSGGGAGN